MRRSGFGTLILIVVVAIVLVLAAKNWQAVKSAKPAIEAGDARSLPGMDNMKSKTSEHTQEIDEALER